MVKNTTITKWAEGFEFATLGLHETAEEDSFLTENFDIEKSIIQ